MYKLQHKPTFFQLKGFPVSLGHPLDEDAVALGGGGRLRRRGQHQRLPGRPVARRLVPLRNRRLLLLLLHVVLLGLLLLLGGVGRSQYVILEMFHEFIVNFSSFRN